MRCFHYARVICLLSVVGLLSAGVALSAPAVGTLSASQTSLLAGVSTPVTFSVQISDPSVLSNGVSLLETDASGNNTSTLGVMISAGNNQFTLTVALIPPTGATKMYFEASAAFKGVLQRVKTPVLAISVLTPTTTIAISPGALTFAAQNVGQASTPQSFTIKNTGNQSVMISSIKASGDFAISANTCPGTLASSAQCTVSVTFKPTAAGARASSVVITDNAGGSPQTVALSGTGQQPQTTTITLNPTALTFAAQTINTTSSAQSFTITNSGTQTVTISSIKTSGDFASSANTCPGTLASSAQCTVSVTFKPTAAGARTSSVVITDNASGSPQTVALSGTGQQPQTTTITLNPTALTFAAQTINTTSSAQSFTITNSGTQNVTISSIKTSGDFAISANTCPGTLASRAQCTVSVTFKPTAAGARTSSVVITDNASGSPQTVALSGTGQQPQTTTITLNPTALTFAARTINTTSSAQSFTITNSGTQTVTISSIKASGDFAISTNTCPGTLASSAQCTVSVTFKPTAAGARASNVVITDNAGGSPQTVALSGTGQQPQTTTITLNPTALTFAAQTINTTSSAQSFTITNSGTQTVTISSIKASGDFAISANTCPGTLTSSAQCTVSVTFKPTAAGARTSSVVITDNASGSPQTVALSGTGQQPQTTTITLNPTALTFAAQTINTTSSAQSFTITNSGTQTVTISSIKTSGDFAISTNTCPGTLASSAQCAVGVTFKPTAAGARASNVVITDNAGGSPQTVALSGTGQQPQTTTITLNPTALTFAAQTINTTSSAQSFTITNSGTQTITISSIKTSGDFAISANTCPGTLTGSAQCVVGVTFKPTAAGARASSVVITDNASGSPQTVALSGTGQQPQTTTITLNPTALTFAAQTINTTSSAQSFTITNSGTQTVTISSIKTSGDFAISTNTCPGPLTSSAQCVVGITFKPTATGARTSSVVITDNAGGSPQTVALSGTGQQPQTTTITLNPTALTFAAQTINTTSSAQSFTITNSGTQTVTISSIKASGDFAISANTCPGTLTSSAQCTVSVTFKPTAAGARNSSVAITDNASGSPQSVMLSGTGQQSSGPFSITSFSPKTGDIGTLVKVGLSNFAPGQGIAPTVTMAALNGGSIAAPVSAFSANALSFVVPPGAASGNFTVTLDTQHATSASAFAVTPSSDITLNVGPATATLIQGQSVTFAVTLNSANGFSGLATLSVSGVPGGMQSSFKPSAVAAGQTATLTLSAPANQAKGLAKLTISAAATIDGQTVSQSASASLNVTPVTTSFLGRTVVDDAQESPVAGVTVKFLGKDARGNTTGCSGQTVSDASGNFALTNLASSCIGVQLISYDGTTATSPAGKYAGVNLSYTLTSGQVTSSPVLVHLPRIDNAETVKVQQNATTDQVFTFSSIPGLQVTVYAGTTIALDDGSKPDPFPLTAMDIPLDRLPEKTPTNGMLMNFVVAFQPANATASQPVAVVFPNPLNAPAKSTAMLTTLDPTRGYMVPYGTTTVAADGRTFMPDLDPAHPGHRYGLVHFDWHTPLSQLVDNFLIGLEHCFTCNPIDIATGVETYTTTDLQIRGGRGSMSVQRTYRTLSTNPGPFGIGTGFNYSMALNLTGYMDGQAFLLFITPTGNQYTLSAASDGTFFNGTIPALRGVVLTPNKSAGVYTLRQSDGTVYTFQTFGSQGAFGAYLTSITDLNGNTTTLTLNPAQPIQVLKVTDPVGRSMNLTYDNSDRITQIADPIGRTVKYTYNAQGTLATFTDANGGVTSYTYNSSNSVVTITDPRGIVTETNTYNEAGDGRVVQQVDANGGVTQFDYTLLNPAAALLKIATNGFSPVLQTVVTDPLGHQTTYRFNPAGLLQSATDPSGQTTTITHDVSHNNLITGYRGAGVCIICGNRANGDMSYTYDQFGNQLTRTDALGHTATFTYDLRFNKVNSITDPLGNMTKFVYDGNGNLLTITDANSHQTYLAYDAFGEVIQITDAVGAKTAISYDSFGNITSVTDALGHTTMLSYDAVARVIQVADVLGRKNSATYDNLDRLTSGTDPNGSATHFVYDQIGDLLSVTDARNNVVRFAYDAIGRLQTRISPLGKTETVKYDFNSNPVQYVDRRGQVSAFEYDVNNRLTRQSYTDSIVTGSYDANGRLLLVNDSQGGSFGFKYDVTGRLLSQSEPTGSIEFARDALGRIATRQVVGQSAVSYTYDPAGAMLSAASPEASVNYQYDSRKLPISLSRANGVTTTYAYDQVGEVLSIVHAKGSQVLNTQRYAYDSVGNRSIISNDINQPLSTASVKSTVNAANELEASGTIAYTYDANGNRLTEAGPNRNVMYSWDSRNRLSLVSDGDGNSAALHYDFGRNLLGITYSSRSNLMQQNFIVDDIRNVVGFTETTGSTLSVLTGLAVDSVYSSVDSGGKVSFGITDAVGSTVGITDGSGVIASKFAYEPYGQSTGNVQAGYPFLFTGRVPIWGSVNYYRDRYYDSQDGRFLSEDPGGLLGGINLYVYGFGNPISNNDPTGDDPAEDAGIGGLSTIFDCDNNVKNIIKNVVIGGIGSKVGELAGDRIGQYTGSAAGAAAVGVVGFFAPEEALGASGAAAFFVVAIPVANFTKAIVGGVVGASGDVVNQIGNAHYDYKATIAAFGGGFASSYAKSFKVKTALGLVYNGIKRVVCGCPSAISDFGDPNLPFSKGPV